MSEETRLVFRGYKCARIIEALADMYGISLAEAAEIYYGSDTSSLIEEGVADLHCRSERYLAELVWEEHCEEMQE